MVSVISDWRKFKYFKNYCPIATLSTVSPTQTAKEINPGLHSKQSANYYLKY
jgi:hypothetical protein